MCGIAGIILSTGDGMPFLLKALDVLNTRGYDGYGVAFGNKILKAGHKELEKLKASVKREKLSGTTGIAHNRWATHGPATQINAHPHACGAITVVHNGDIDNYLELKAQLIAEGFKFQSETDSEVLAVLIEYYRPAYTFFESVEKALSRLGETSTYALLVTDATEKGQIIAACKGSRPLLWSLEKGATYIASEESALNGFVERYQELHDGEIALFEAGKLVERESLINKPTKHSVTYTIDPEHYKVPEKTSEYWMYQEMMEAPEVIRKALGRRVTLDEGIVLGGISDSKIQERLRGIRKFYLAGCGTSYHGALIIADALQEIAGVEAEAIIASEAVYKKTVFDPKTTALVAISQSGETADLVRLMDEWRPQGMLMLGIVNVPNTQIPKRTDAGIYCHIGRESAVASTKAFLGQVICGIMFALSVGQQRGLSSVVRDQYIAELLALPDKATEILKQEKRIQQLAEKYKEAKNFLFIGRRYSATVACEGALKLKEITWNDEGGVHAIGIAAGEMKHGTLAMIDKSFPTFVIAPYDSVYVPTMRNVSEIMAREGNIILVTTPDAPLVDGIDLNDTIMLPKTMECLSPIISVIPTQIFAFHMSIIRGCHPDMPRNLAKAVTVE